MEFCLDITKLNLFVHLTHLEVNNSQAALTPACWMRTNAHLESGSNTSHTIQPQTPYFIERPTIRARKPSLTRQNFLKTFRFEILASRPSSSTTTAKMSAANKIAANSPSRQNPSELEQSLAQALYDLETNTADLKTALRPLQFVSAREVRT